MEFTQGVRFDSLGLTEEVQRALKKKNIEESTPVQAGCIPPMREWKDVIAKAPTGTGKTFAFGIPIIEHIEPGSEETEAVILAPTRELAMQITAELRDLCVYLPGVRIVCLYGGAPIGKQIDALKKHPQIVVATPGRLSDHMKRRTVKLDNVKTVVLDEADRMLDMGFLPAVRRIVGYTRDDRQTLLFSATLDEQAVGSITDLVHDPARVEIAPVTSTADTVEQYVLPVSLEAKNALLASVLKREGSSRVIVFCRTKHRADACSRRLARAGITCAAIHGDRSQAQRERALKAFRSGQCDVLVATNVLARGIDISDVRFDALTTVVDAKDYGLGNAVDSSVITYFNPLMHTAVFRVYAEELSYVRQHPLTLRRYMWKLEY